MDDPHVGGLTFSGPTSELRLRSLSSATSEESGCCGRRVMRAMISPNGLCAVVLSGVFGLGVFPEAASSCCATSRTILVRTFCVEVRGKSGSGQSSQRRICWCAASAALARRMAASALLVAPEESRMSNTAQGSAFPLRSRPKTTESRISGCARSAASRSSG